MSYSLLTKDRRKKNVNVPVVDNEQVQIDWIKGLVEQIEFANRSDVLPSYILELTIIRRRLEP